jgi:hypothetical protein
MSYNSPATRPMSYNSPATRASRVSTVSSMPLREYSRNMGMSEPTQNTHIEHYDLSETVDEQKLLDVARSAPPHPEPMFTSKLRSLGNPLVGDLVIPPRRAGVSLPYNASPDDLRPGYFTAL